MPSNSCCATACLALAFLTSAATPCPMLTCCRCGRTASTWPRRGANPTATSKRPRCVCACSSLVPLLPVHVGYFDRVRVCFVCPLSIVCVFVCVCAPCPAPTHARPGTSRTTTRYSEAHWLSHSPSRAAPALHPHPVRARVTPYFVCCCVCAANCVHPCPSCKSLTQRTSTRSTAPWA
jgi:hypothetical protein